MSANSSTDTADKVANCKLDHRLAANTVFRHLIRVYYEDTDAAGVVYYANYLRYMERGRTEWLRALGHPVEQLAAQRGRAFVVARAYVDYHGPARLGDQLAVSVALDEQSATQGGDHAGNRAQNSGKNSARSSARSSAIKGAVINMRQTVDLGETTIVTARIRLACVRTTDLRPTRIPDDLIASLNNADAR